MANMSHIPHKVHILLTFDEIKELKDIQRREARKLELSKSVENFKSMTKTAKRLFERVYANFDLKQDIVNNIIAYSKCLPKPGTIVIDKNVFQAQMRRHFHLTNAYMLERLWHIVTFGELNCKISCYVELIAIFLCGINDYKVQLVFKVYNFTDDGLISKKDIEHFIRPMMVNIGLLEENSEDFCVKDFVDMLLGAVDKNADEFMELDEFREITKHNILMMECLGPCLPPERQRKTFMHHLTDKTPSEAMALFRFERKISLQSAPKVAKSEGIQKYYPIRLEIP